MRVAYSHDGTRIVTGAADGAVSTWNAADLQLLGTVVPPHRSETAVSVRFIGSSHDVVIASHDGSVYRWRTDVARTLDIACRMAGRTLTRDEWDEYLPEQPYRDVCPQP
jgi:WD40 repeat protein